MLRLHAFVLPRDGVGRALQGALHVVSGGARDAHALDVAQETRHERVVVSGGRVKPHAVGVDRLAREELSARGQKLPRVKELPGSRAKVVLGEKHPLGSIDRDRGVTRPAPTMHAEGEAPDDEFEVVLLGHSHALGEKRRLGPTILVEHEDVVAVASAEREFEGGPGAARGGGERLHPHVPVGNGREQGGGAIRRAIVHGHDLVVVIRLAMDALDRPPNRRLGVVGRDDDRHERLVMRCTRHAKKRLPSPQSRTHSHRTNTVQVISRQSSACGGGVDASRFQQNHRPVKGGRLGWDRIRTRR